MRPIWQLTIVAAMLVIAGCAGAGAPPGDSGASADGTAAPADGSDDSSSSNDDSSSGDDASSGDAFEDGEFDVSDPERILRDAGSFTASWSFVVDEAGAESSITNVYTVDLDTNRSFEVFTVTGDEEGLSFERFYADGTSYTRYETDGESFYQVLPQESAVLEEALARGVWGYADADDATFAGTETFDGVTVGRYEYTDRTLWRTFGAGTFDAESEVTVTDFTVSVLVDGDGLARSTSWTLVGENEDGERFTAEWTYTVTDVGATSVVDPDWLDDAEAQSFSAFAARPR